MSNQLIDKALAWIGNRLRYMGDYYTSEWSATSTSSAGTVLTASVVTLPAGIYIVSVVAPICSAKCITTLKVGGSMFDPVRYHFIDTSTGFTEIIHTTKAGIISLTAEQSSTVTFSNLSRGYMRIMRMR